MLKDFNHDDLKMYTDRTLSLLEQKELSSQVTNSDSSEEPTSLQLNTKSKLGGDLQDWLIVNTEKLSLEHLHVASEDASMLADNRLELIASNERCIEFLRSRNVEAPGYEFIMLTSEEQARMKRIVGVWSSSSPTDQQSP